jgi:tRNA 2-thiouridine synthesizing protein D
MGKLLIILCEAPFQSEQVNYALKIAERALEKGHGVSFFITMDGIYNLITTQKGKALQIKPIVERFKELMVKGARIICCKLCMELRGVEKSMIPEEVTVGELSDLRNEIQEADCVLSFTGRK